jgi:hypothetical protein
MTEASAGEGHWGAQDRLWAYCSRALWRRALQLSTRRQSAHAQGRAVISFVRLQVNETFGQKGFKQPVNATCSARRPGGRQQRADRLWSMQQRRAVECLLR